MKGINPQKSNLSIICYDLSNLSEYAKVNNSAFKLMKKNLPRFFHLHPADKQRIAENIQKQERSRYPCAGQQYYPTPGKGAGNPILTMSVHDDDDVIEYSTDPELIHEKYENTVDIVIDGGYGGFEASTVVDCTTDEFEIVRQGKVY